METVLLEILGTQDRCGMAKDLLALLAGTTERRGDFRDALATLIGSKLVSMGTGARVRITPEGRTAVEGAASKTIFERLAILRSGREPYDERVIACLSAAGHVPLQFAEIRERTGLGPRILKTALQRLRRDGWIVERRGAFMTSPALARLIGR
ncbi:hypothetical protein [Mesorhizobium sp. ORS 3428]|uniref:hypothetical protein n=1 Tax=Mesorhizobium sp. ORS 3428 TaxID=540997 RepID=UPI0008DAD69C|nr:hypothetical protein [Mesorhizobium sp. ORS 3428]OHV82554.1 hypothetical protein ORS3428_27360 [Mesorhizobium sp. ORS 3428]